MEGSIIVVVRLLKWDIILAPVTECHLRERERGISSMKGQRSETSVRDNGRLQHLQEERKGSLSGEDSV